MDPTPAEEPRKVSTGVRGSVPAKVRQTSRNIDRCQELLRSSRTVEEFEFWQQEKSKVIREYGKWLSERYHWSSIARLKVPADYTGRRISAVLSLRFEDLRLDLKPNGAIAWPSDTDKMGRAWMAPLDKDGRAAIDRVRRERPGIGGFLFPDPTDATKQVSRYAADRWLLKAEELAGVPKQKGSLWHAYRRKWATERKHLPDVDVAAVGGWSDLSSLKTAYQQADPETMQRVVSEPRRLREAGGGLRQSAPATLETAITSEPWTSIEPISTTF